jgi:hypothetical protein
MKLLNGRINSLLRNCCLGYCGICGGLSGIRGFLVGAPYCDGSNGIDDKNEKTKTLKSKRNPIYPIALCIAGYFGMIATWLSVGLCRKW